MRSSEGLVSQMHACGALLTSAICVVAPDADCTSEYLFGTQHVVMSTSFLSRLSLKNSLWLSEVPMRAEELTPSWCQQQWPLHTNAGPVLCLPGHAPLHRQSPCHCNGT